ncbi:MAG: CRISPR system precrRNA processing endoribonuclease RAMP protein Cas6 [bacterium]
MSQADTRSNPAPILRVSSFLLEFKALNGIQLNDFTGSMWRGSFGHSLKKSVCVTHESNCDQCMLYQTCAYSYLFETPPPSNAEKMRKYNAIPHPFVLHVPSHQKGEVKAGDTLSLGLTLIGKSNQQLPYVIHAFKLVGDNGITKTKAKLSLESVLHVGRDTNNIVFTKGSQLSPVTNAPISIPPLPDKDITIILETPFRVKSRGHFVKPQQFDFFSLFSSLLRRISMLTNFHTDTPLETNFAFLSQQAKTIKLKKTSLHWKDWTRYSSRQQTSLQMGGLIGTITLSTKELEPFWPYLWIGQTVHAGKGTSMGLGQYTITTKSFS